MNIAFFDTKPYDISSFTRYAEQEGIAIKFFESKLTLDTVALAEGADAVCVFVNDTLNAEVIDRLVSLGVRAIALRCAGFNHVAMDHAMGKIRVFHVPSYSPHAVAEHTMALLLTSIRRIHKAYNRTRDFNFSLVGMTGMGLYGKTVGIIGMGRIGRIFCDICRGFGMRILAYDKYASRDCEGVRFCELSELFRESDVISLHCPLTEQTYHLIDERALAQCKRGVILLNTSRGALVDAEALLASIKARHVGAACLDVYEEEEKLFFEDFSGHILDDDILARLISMPNVIVTSHQAFLTEEALDSIAATTIENLVALKNNTPSPNEITYHP